MESPTIIILTADGGRQFVVNDVRVARLIGSIKPMLDSLLKDRKGTVSAEPLVFPLPLVPAGTLERVLEYLEMHRDDPQMKTFANQHRRLTLPAGTSTLSSTSDSEDEEKDDEEVDIISPPAEDDSKDPLDEILEYANLTSPWDRKFAESLDIGSLIELTKAANYLYIRPLLDLCCKTIAGHIQGLSVAELRQKFNISNDFTPEEEEKLKAVNPVSFFIFICQ